ncbi:MAG: MFS transporter [Spirochaetaceae bacterium]|nr:MAG: MFS transporter [Spirochaetaceae bacterium]
MTDSLRGDQPFILFPALLLALVVFFNFTARIVFSPLLLTIEHELQLSHAQTGTFFLLITFGYTAAILLSGFLAARIHHRGVIIISIAAVGVALVLIAGSRSVTQIRVGLVVLGMSAGLYSPSGIAALTGAVSRRHWGKAMAIHDLGPNLAFIVAPAAATLFIGGPGWRALLMTVGTLCIATSGLFAMLSRMGRFPGQPPYLRNIRAILSQRVFWVVALYFAIAITGALGVFAVIPTYLVSERGMPHEYANLLVSASRLTVLPVIFLAGWLRDRLGERLLIGAVTLITGILTLLLGLAPDWLLPLVVILQPMVLASFFPAAFSAIASIGPPETRNVAVSLMTPGCYIVGGGVFPAVMGVLGDRGLFFVGFTLVGVIALASLVFLPLLTLPPVADQAA